MILEPGTVKGNIFDAFFQSAFSDSFTHSCCSVFVTGVLQLFSDSFFYSRSSYQKLQNHSVQLPVRKCDAGYDVPPGELRPAPGACGVRGSHDGYEQISYP
ncbi:Uncharacterised protein [Klebsiella pneumoniae]|uniref:Uncharacterized protein n=1 Tax=Klebsiella pneumoniae TaxID=573 RepID=A0A2X3GMW8_KLEPN|nr:Uncharacterised protein [Klebsiella pneumoniae]